MCMCPYHKPASDHHACVTFLKCRTWLLVRYQHPKHHSRLSHCSSFGKQSGINCSGVHATIPAVPSSTQQKSSFQAHSRRVQGNHAHASCCSLQSTIDNCMQQLSSSRAAAAVSHDMELAGARGGCSCGDRWQPHSWAGGPWPQRLGHIHR